MKTKLIGAVLLAATFTVPNTTLAGDIGIERLGGQGTTERVYKCTNCDTAVFHLQRANSENTGELRRRAMRRCRQADMDARRLVELPGSSGTQRRSLTSYILVCSNR